MLAVFGNVISNYRIDQMHLLAYFLGMSNETSQSK